MEPPSASCIVHLSLQEEKAAKFKKRFNRAAIYWDPYTTITGLCEDTVMSIIYKEYFATCNTSTTMLNGLEDYQETSVLGNARADTPAWCIASLGHLPTDVRAYETMQNGDKGGS